MYNVQIHQRIILYQRRQPSMDSVLCRQWHNLTHSFTPSTTQLTFSFARIHTPINLMEFTRRGAVRVDAQHVPQEIGEILISALIH